MRQVLIFTLMISMMVTGLSGQNQKAGVTLLKYAPPDPTSPVPGELVRKLPVQISLSCKQNDQALLQPFVGTGFLVRIKVPPADKDVAFYYLVTNRHVAECWNETNHPQQVVSIGVRINTQDSGAVSLLLNSNGNTNWFYPDDDSIDLAVTPFQLPINLKPDIIVLDFDSFATRESLRQHRIGEGSTIIITGYFLQFPGQRRFQPILRQGILSMIADEPMMTTTGRLGTVYLADVHIFGGNSGSPVLAMPQDDVIHAGEHWFIGIVSGYYFEKADARMEIATTVKGETAANSGVAMIVPADEVKKLIEDNHILKGYRDAYLSTLQKESPAVPHVP
jgi:hypothetical protein